VFCIDGVDLVRNWSIATLPQEFKSAMPPKADKPKLARMTGVTVAQRHEPPLMTRLFRQLGRAESGKPCRSIRIT